MCYSITVKGESWNSISTRISPLIDLKMPLPVIHFFAWWEMFRGWRCIYNDYKALPWGSVVDISRLCYILLTTWPRNHYQWHILCLFEVCKVTKHLILSDSVNSGEKGYCLDFQGMQWEREWIKSKSKKWRASSKKNPRFVSAWDALITKIVEGYECVHMIIPKSCVPFLKLQGQQNVHLLKEW